MQQGGGRQKLSGRLPAELLRQQPRKQGRPLQRLRSGLRDKGHEGIRRGTSSGAHRGTVTGSVSHRLGSLKAQAAVCGRDAA